MTADWSRRRFLATATAAAASVASYASQRKVTRQSLKDSDGTEYLKISAGQFRMGETRPIPPAMCEPLAYMTRGELQKMFPHGDPARLVLSDVLFRHGDPDEGPRLVRVQAPFYLSATQVTNRQYERFDPSHRAVRGKFGFSSGDDEAVVYVSWQDAMGYCAWLSQREGRLFRLPTEAEWEYAARAGTSTLFSTGDHLPDVFLKNARVTDFTAPEDKVTLTVGQTPANPWGLYDMHGNVEEWVHDWYAPEAAANGGPDHGVFKVTRGGSHGTFAYYLRSANRAAALPETRGFTIGFRVASGQPVGGDVAAERRLPAKMFGVPRALGPAAANHRSVTRAEPYFRGPVPFVKVPATASGPLYAWHNHDTALTECPNGDLLAAWYTCAREQGRELSVAASRLPAGGESWGEATSFYDTPDRNDHCPGLWFDGEQTLYHLNGTALSHYWEPLQIILRTSIDNGVTWSAPRYIAPDFGLRHMVCQPIRVLRNGWWIFGADAHPAGSALWLSKDRGATWECRPGTIHGIHAAIVELRDGRLMALGRGANLGGHMPMSLSDDYGATWTAQPTELPPITYTQRFAMTRLHEGPLALVTFLPDVSELKAEQKTDRELAKLCVCLSYDEGKTWPKRRVLSAESTDRGVPGMSGGRVYLGPGASEPTGYCSILQSRDGLIHVLSSMNHYAFNLEWAESGPSRPDPMPQPRSLPRKERLGNYVEAQPSVSAQGSSPLWTNERTGAMDGFDLAKGCSVEVMLPGVAREATAAEDVAVLKFYARSGCTMCNRYWLRLRTEGADYWYAGTWQALPKVSEHGMPLCYRMCVREDTCVQIYGGEHLLATFPPSYEIGFAMPTRGNWIEWESPTRRQASLGFDLEGAFSPGETNASGTAGSQTSQ